MKYSHKSMGKENGSAEVYATPHTPKGKKMDIKDDVGLPVKMPTRKNWTPLNGGVGIGNNWEVKTTGEETRGNGAAERGTIARGPLA